MSDPDRLLADLWAADEPAERDHLFVLSVAAEIERRQFWLGLASMVPIAVAAAAILWAIEPLILQTAQGWLTFAGQPAVATAAAGVVLALWMWSAVSGRPSPMDS